MKLNTDFSLLKLVGYSGAGNITPVVDISSILPDGNLPVIALRAALEKNHSFRVWLKEEGLKNKADSVILYYKSTVDEYDYICFVAEPNVSLNSSFSDMCGNGIRALGFHLYLRNLKRKTLEKQSIFRIFAGSVKKVRVLKISKFQTKATVSVELGEFRSKRIQLKEYVNVNLFGSIKDFNRFKMPPGLLLPALYSLNFGLGMNSDTYMGEPHIILLLDRSEYISLYEQFFTSKITKHFQHGKLRIMTSYFGSKITFNKKFFPKGINFSIALIIENKIYISTHERNLNLYQNCIKKSRDKKHYCSCNTQACGTAGAVAANLAKLNLCIASDLITTVHAGGEIMYILSDKTTTMTGGVEQL